MIAFSNFKNNDIISAKSSFYCFRIRTLGGGGGERGLQKSTFCTLVKMMNLMDDP